MRLHWLSLSLPPFPESLFAEEPQRCLFHECLQTSLIENHLYPHNLEVINDHLFTCIMESRAVIKNKSEILYFLRSVLDSTANKPFRLMKSGFMDCTLLGSSECLPVGLGALLSCH